MEGVIMKRLIAMVIIAIVLCSFSACTQEAYETTSYADGYSDGYSEAEFELQYLLDEEFLYGYDCGYDDGYREAEEEYSDYGWLEFEASHYARDHSGWNPEEAWALIEAYHNNEPFYADGSYPSKEDYLDAINSLIYFYNYFYSKEYE